MVASFFNFVADHPQETLQYFDKAKQFINAHLKCEYFARAKILGLDWAAFPLSIYVGSLEAVLHARERVKAKRHQQSIDNHEELQAELCDGPTDQQHDEM